ncbi:S26 family signal peptidase [Natrarchaeobaculum sulfurireducens]|uniref:Signal peptidase I n=1 Tax=Natrarchaeobaculum sulfurireducens TaxID=2044521 RepID=A0A346PKJ1_9EURY|nr:S26 family signal peptidase [Natrarchaeobaculum sulfurireducens]AXR76357.1 Signal peptidase I [Natrarchaeobaculum sulfurireducens]AXR80036.1 Signal peptidase I [Natrarchaeobaculum sulfurireducens]
MSGPDSDGYEGGGKPDRDDVATDSSSVTIEDDGVVRWFLRSDDDTIVLVRDVVSSVAIVAVIGLLLFGVSGIWPPLVAVESGSMEPNMERGDLIFVVDTDRFVGDDPVEGTGVVPLEHAERNGDESFGKSGDVIVFKPNGDGHETPVIHRAHYWVEEGDNWVDEQADEEVIGDATCDDVPTCPANRDGFITKGDANGGYDQYRGGAQTDVVEPDWVTGKAQYRIPWLGYVRLFFDGLFSGLIAPISPANGPATIAIGIESASAQTTVGSSPTAAGSGVVTALTIGR